MTSLPQPYRFACVLFFALVGLVVFVPRAAASEPDAADQPPASDSPIITDRPDVAEAPQTVGLLRFQIEMGISTARSPVVIDDATQNTFGLSTPTKLRFGIHDRIELHLESDGFMYNNGNNNQDTQAGAADLDFGTKVWLLAEDGLIPALGLLMAYTAPTGSDAFSEAQHSLSPTLAASWALSDTFSFSTNLGVTTMLSGRDTNSDVFRYAGALGVVLTDALTLFIEHFGEVSFEGEAALSADGGATYLLTPDLQLDLNVRVGLNDAAPDDIGGGCGVAVRF